MVLLGLVLAVALVVVATRLKLNLGHGLLAGCLVLGFTGAMSPGSWLLAILRGWISPKGLTLMVVVCLLMILSQLLEMTGQMASLFQRFQRLIRRPALSLSLFPALIGLLPMPGGAVFSAPLVASAARGLDLSPAHLSLVNYWFRHVWEYVWPLYPSIIVIVSLAGLPFSALLPVLAPITGVAIVFGYLFILRHLKPAAELETAAGGGSLIGAVPIVMVLLGALTGGWLLDRLAGVLPWASRLPAQTPVALALVLAVLFSGLTARRPGLILKAVFSRNTGGMVYMILTIVAFQSVTLASGGVDALSQLLTRHGLPLIVLVTGLSFSLGLVTGIAVGYAATGFPVFIGLLPPESLTAYLMLAHVAGFTGVLLSPAHACLVLSNSYFQCQPGEFYRRLWPPTLLTLAGAFVWFYLIK